MFGRKKKKEETIPMPIFEHKHMWRDFPWYLDTIYHIDQRRLHYKFIENYVCTLCGERKQIVLHEGDRCKISSQEADAIINDFTKKYADYLKPKVIVEDMINDAILVDRERLKLWDKLKGFDFDSEPKLIMEGDE